MTTENREELIRTRAYQRWVAEGMPEGRDNHYWYEAEKEVDAEYSNGGGNGSDNGASGGEISALPEIASSASGPKARTRVSKKSADEPASTGTSRAKRTTTK